MLGENEDHDYVGWDRSVMVWSTNELPMLEFRLLRGLATVTRLKKAFS